MKRRRWAFAVFKLTAIISAADCSCAAVKCCDVSVLFGDVLVGFIHLLAGSISHLIDAGADDTGHLMACHFGYFAAGQCKLLDGLCFLAELQRTTQPA